MQYDFSVVVLTYFPIKNKLFSTLNSIISPKNISFEIVITDDGSDQFCQQEICDFMEAHHFANYKILANPVNQGTVKNLLGALRICQGKYVKAISPGDLLYCEHTLADLNNFMTEHQAKVVFSDLAYYDYENGKIHVYNARQPWDCSIYAPDDSYSQNKVIKHLMVYSDSICGAGIAAERNLLLEQLSRIEGIIVYAEDLVVQLMAVLGHRIWKFPGIMVWYEFGSGISTSGSQGFSLKIRKDFQNFMKWIVDNYPDNRSAKTALKIRNCIDQNDRIGIHIHRLLHWDEIAFIMRKKLFFKKYAAPKIDEEIFHQFYISDCKEN